MDLDLQNNVIWQPSFAGGVTNFQVAFDRNFVINMINTKVTDKDQRNLNDLAIELLKIKNPPYQFYHDSLLVD